jgi:transcriptional regulator with PAS, ATPase and Fis domain
MEYKDFSWIKEFPAAITVCDAQGIILEMNDKSASTFAKDGGRALVGTNLLDCHPDPARGKVESLMDRQQKNVYTIEKNGIHKLIYQSPWYKNGQFAGFVEFSFEIPSGIPHLVHD